MIIAFKNIAASPGSRVNQLIGWWTGSAWTHCEIVLETYDYQCVSSRIETQGVVFLPHQAVVRSADQWEFYQIPLASEAPVHAFLTSQAHAPYNYRGIAVDLFLGLDGQQPGAWFCSELSTYVLQLYADLPIPFMDPARVTPGQLRSMLRALGCPQLRYQP